MNISKRNYYEYNLLHLLMFVNILIYTLIASLVLFHTLVLLKVLIIKFILLSLHKYKVFPFLFSVAVAIYCWIDAQMHFSLPDYSVSQEILDAVEADRVKYRDRDRHSKKVQREEWSTTGFVVLAIITFGIGFGVPAIQYFYPEAIPAVTSAIASVGAAVLSVFQEISVSVSEDVTERLEKLKVPVVEEPPISEADAEAKAKRTAELRASIYVRIAFSIIKNNLYLNPHGPEYLGLITLLYQNNIPSTVLLKQETLCEVVDMLIHDPEKAASLYTAPLNRVDSVFYKILFAIPKPKP